MLLPRKSVSDLTEAGNGELDLLSNRRARGCPKRLRYGPEVDSSSPVIEIGTMPPAPAISAKTSWAFNAARTFYPGSLSFAGRRVNGPSHLEFCYPFFSTTQPIHFFASYEDFLQVSRINRDPNQGFAPRCQVAESAKKKTVNDE
jgi:hypothetical protein